MNFGKKKIQFTSVEDAQAYIANLKTGVETVEGETTAFAVVDDRTLAEAKSERRAYVQAEAKALLDTFTCTYDEVQARAGNALAAIDAAQSNAEVDAVMF
jgi:hypothetical protein